MWTERNSYSNAAKLHFTLLKSDYAYSFVEKKGWKTFNGLKILFSLWNAFLFPYKSNSFVWRSDLEIVNHSVVQFRNRNGE